MEVRCGHLYTHDVDLSQYREAAMPPHILCCGSEFRKVDFSAIPKSTCTVLYGAGYGFDCINAICVCQDSLQRLYSSQYSTVTKGPSVVEGEHTFRGMEIV